MIADHLDEGLAHAEEELALYREVEQRPSSMDDATINRALSAVNEQLEHIDYFDEQIERWRTQKLNAEQVCTLARARSTNEKLPSDERGVSSTHSRPAR